MNKEINVTWQGGMAFTTEIDGHKIIVDAGIENDGQNKGPRPKTLMLLALGGCTGMDVVSILKKMRVVVEHFNMRVVGQLTEEHPKHFDKMKIIYEFKGDNLSEEKLRKAVDLSIERYCGVSAVYRKALDFTYEIVIM